MVRNFPFIYREVCLAGSSLAFMGTGREKPELAADTIIAVKATFEAHWAAVKTLG